MVLVVALAFFAVVTVAGVVAYRRISAARIAASEPDPEVALIVAELDAELAREFELLEDGIGAADRVAVRDIGDLLRTFAQRCHKIALVGSRRRQSPSARDVDVLYIPKSNLQVVEFLEQMADDERSIRDLSNGWSCTIGGQRVDFIQSSKDHWGCHMIHYTGSREFNQMVWRFAQRRGYAVQSNGRITKQKSGTYGSTTVDAFSGWSEEQILTHLGLGRYLDPRTRNDDAPTLKVIRGEDPSDEAMRRMLA